MPLLALARRATPHFTTHLLRSWLKGKWRLLCLVTLAFIIVYVFIAPWRGHENSTDWKESSGHPGDGLWKGPPETQHSLKVYVVEEHHEVIPVWVNYLRRLNGKKATLIHVDAHGDMDFPELVDGFPLGRFPQNDFEVSTMMQANDVFIQSAIAGQLLKSVHFVFPPWVPTECFDEQFYLGTHGIDADTQLCLCQKSSASLCKTPSRNGYMNELWISPKECHEKWVFTHHECGSNDVAPLLRAKLENSTGFSSYSPVTRSALEQQYTEELIILDIDEDFFGVHLASRNLTDTGLNIIVILQIDRKIQSIFCPNESVDEIFIDIWFQELLAYLIATCASGHLELQNLVKLQHNISKRAHEDLSQRHSGWLCQDDIEPAISELVEILTHPTITAEQLSALARVGVCFTDALSSFGYEPRMHLCIGHNSPAMSLVSEHIPVPAELTLLASNLTSVLLAIPRQPVLITLCRSSRDGYTPRWLQPAIEYTVIGLLKRVFKLKQEDVRYSPHLAGGIGGWHERHP